MTNLNDYSQSKIKHKITIKNQTLLKLSNEIHTLKLYNTFTVLS